MKVQAQMIHQILFKEKRLSQFLDSLKAVILADTIKYKRGDIIQSKEGIENKNRYSKLYIIQDLKNDDKFKLNYYSYRLDIVEPKKVVEFVKEYLNDKVIKSVMVINEVDTIQHPNIPGIIWIDTLGKAKFNPVVAGLTINKKGGGNNFTKRKKLVKQKP